MKRVSLVSAWNPLSFRDRLSLVFPDWLVSLLGPYPDEVPPWLYALLFVAKVAVMAPLFWLVIDLVLPKTLGDEFAKSMIVSGLAAMTLAYFSKDESS